MLDCIISSPDFIKKHSQVRSVFLPALKGQMQVLSGHAETFVLLTKGKIVFNKEGENKEEMEIEQGGCYINNNKINIIL